MGHLAAPDNDWRFTHCAWGAPRSNSHGKKVRGWYIGIHAESVSDARVEVCQVCTRRLRDVSAGWACKQQADGTALWALLQRDGAR